MALSAVFEYVLSPALSDGDWRVACNGKSLERAGSVTGEVELCSGLVDDGGTHRIIAGDTWNLVFIIVSSYLTSWA